MPHRSDQAVESQGRAPESEGDDTAPPRRLIQRRPITLSAVGAGVVVLAAGVWFGRIPLAEGLIKTQLASLGVESDLQILTLDFGGSTIGAFRLGPETAPDVAISGADIYWRWAGLSPQLESIHLVEPRIRLRVEPGGRVSAGSLDNFSAGEPSGKRAAIPRIRLDIEDGSVLVDAPFGAITAAFHASGTLGRDFSALARIEPTTRPGDHYALANGQAELSATSNDDQLNVRFTAGADNAIWSGAAFGGVALNVTAQAPLDLASASLQAAWRGARIRSGETLEADGVTGALTAQATMQDDALKPTTWTADANVNARRLLLADQTLTNGALNARASGDDDKGEGAWTLTAGRYDGLSMISQRPSGHGDVHFDMSGDEKLVANAELRLADTALNDDAQRTLRNAFPDIDSAPIGPTFASAERALDAAADRFELVAPIAYRIDANGARVVVPSAINARAANGVALTISPARENSSALTLQWPGPTLGGGVDIQMSGGGAPRLDLLLDSITWASDAPFEAEGTLAISEWQANGASIAADEINVALVVPPEGDGTLTLTGPTRITGPIGDGHVRDLVADLDLAIAWGENGWRVTPTQGCLPVHMGGLDVAGLSFAAGAFQLCAAQGGTLIAANANDQLSGGFNIETLRLDGRMSGPDGQPARLSAARVNARFAGTTSHSQVLVEASTPAIDVVMDPERTIHVQGQRLTADASVGDGTWRVVGAFESGGLEDPTMPGLVTSIGGRWNAAPDENNDVVIRVEAGEAYVNAREAPIDADDRRPLFNPIRLVDVGAVLREGRINAEGRIVLDKGARALANFTATHETGSGEGSAEVIADHLVFNEALQPYEISELARGVIENVRGDASVTANANWDHDNFRVTGVVRPNGISLSSSTIPQITNVNGEVHFDDLILLTTPPGQTLTIGELNPGVAVTNGRLRFQLLPEQQVRIESAEFDFAEGKLSLAPTTITLGAEETRFNLALSNVDMAALIDTLNMPDLAATGRVEGSFPIVLNSRTTIIENGELHAAEGGGEINYVGSAGDNVTGPARVAFDALRSFRYDDLRLTLNGDLSDEVVTSISFSGENTGRPVDLTPIAGTPIGAVNARGVPFAFNVTVTAPFRALAQTASGMFNPSELLGNALDNNPENPPADGESGAGSNPAAQNERQTPASVDVQVAPLR